MRVLLVASALCLAYGKDACADCFDAFPKEFPADSFVNRTKTCAAIGRWILATKP
jgi:hypothetical protein